MSYVVKVKNYYVRTANVEMCYVDKKPKIIHVGDINLSKEMMGGFTKELADKLAESIGGEAILMLEQVTNEEDIK